MTFEDFNAEIRAEAFPELEAENLVTPHTKSIICALIDLQKYITALQERNTSVYPQCSTYYKCGHSAINAPSGFIHRVFTILDDDWDTQITYYPRTYHDFYRWSRRFVELTDYVNPVYGSAVGLGYKYPTSSTDSEYGRSLTGIWTLQRGKLLIAPWIQSNEYAVVEWDGVKRSYLDSDVVEYDEDVKDAIKAYLLWHHNAHYSRENSKAEYFRGLYYEKRADLIYLYSKEQRLPDQGYVPEDASHEIYRQANAEPITASSLTTSQESTMSHVALISDYGTASDTESAIASLIHDNDYDYIMTAGDNNQIDQVSSIEDFHNRVGKYYSRYIYPYYKATDHEHSPVTRNRLFPAVGNHDITSDNKYTDFSNFFNLEQGGHAYQVAVDNVLFFMLNPLDGHVDGNTTRSVQHSWLAKRLAASTYPWNIVITHYPPYTSGTTHGAYENMRWNFHKLGADIVVSGHEHIYERQLIDGYNYIVLPPAGGEERSAYNESENTQIIKPSKSGFADIKAYCDTLTWMAYDSDNAVMDQFTLSK